MERRSDARKKLADAVAAEHEEARRYFEGGDIAAKIEASSLGTPEAQALRATVSDERAARVVARSKELAAPVESADVETLAVLHPGQCCRGYCVDNLLHDLRKYQADRFVEVVTARDAAQQRIGAERALRKFGSDYFLEFQKRNDMGAATVWSMATDRADRITQEDGDE